MNGKIMKKQMLSLIISAVGLSVTAESTLPPFIENNQSKEELVTTENELRFATKFHAEYAKNLSVEFKVFKKRKEASEKAYIQTLKHLGLLNDRQKLETHFRVLLEYADSRDVKFLAMKSLLIAGVLQEESLRAVERIVARKNVPRDLVYLIFMKRHLIFGGRPLKLPLVGKQKYFDFLVEDISSGKRATMGNCADLLKIGKELLNTKSADDAGNIVADMVKIYSGMPKKDQIILAMSFIDIAKKETVKRKYDHLIVNEILKVTSGIKQDEDYKDKHGLLFELSYVTFADGFLKKSINSMKSMFFKSEDRDIVALLLFPLYKVDDSNIEEKAYTLLKESDYDPSRLSACRYFRERKDPSVISTYIEILKSLDVKKMMSKNEDGSLYWMRTSNVTMTIHINEFRGVTTLEKDFETTRKDILEWWDKNSSDERFYFKEKESPKGLAI